MSVTLTTEAYAELCGLIRRAQKIVEKAENLGLCELHPKPVLFEGHECPCCVLMREWNFGEVPK